MWKISRRGQFMLNMPSEKMNTQISVFFIALSIAHFPGFCHDIARKFACVPGMALIYYVINKTVLMATP